MAVSEFHSRIGLATHGRRSVTCQLAYLAAQWGTCRILKTAASSCCFAYTHFTAIAPILQLIHCDVIMKTVLLLIGVAALLIGILWVGQGTGFVRWPASSFMIDERPWISRGAILAVVGLVLIAISRRR